VTGAKTADPVNPYFQPRYHTGGDSVLPTHILCYNSSMASIVDINPNILGGTPVFAGTRVPVESLFDYLKRDRTVDYFLEQFPTVKRKQIEELLDEARAKALSPRVPT